MKRIIALLILIIVTLSACASKTNQGIQDTEKTNKENNGSSVIERKYIHSDTFASNFIDIDSVNYTNFKLPDYINAQGVSYFHYTVAMTALSMTSQLSTDEVAMYAEIIRQPTKTEFNELYMLVGGEDDPLYILVTTNDKDIDTNTVKLDELNEFAKEVFGINDESNKDSQIKVERIVGQDESKVLAEVTYNMIANNETTGVSAEFNLRGYIAISNKDDKSSVGIFLSTYDKWMYDSAVSLECNPNNPGTGLTEDEYIAEMQKQMETISDLIDGDK